MISIPFIGSKKYSYKQVRQIFQENNYNAVYEPFGGSCVLSVNLLNEGLVDKAVINDYDHFFDHYEEYLDLKDKVVEEGYKRGLLRTSHNRDGIYRENKDGSKTQIDSKILQGEERQIIQDIISELVPKEYWRYFSLGNNFCHSGHSLDPEIKLKKFCLFNAYLKTDKQRYYLEKLNCCEMNHLDYHDFLEKYRNDIDGQSLIIVDPPYSNTRQYQYENVFVESDTLELIDILNNLPCDYIFFNRDYNKIKEWFPNSNFVVERTGTLKRRSPSHSTEEYFIYVKQTPETGSFFMPKNGLLNNDKGRITDT